MASEVEWQQIDHLSVNYCIFMYNEIFPPTSPVLQEVGEAQGLMWRHEAWSSSLQNELQMLTSESNNNNTIHQQITSPGWLIFHRIISIK